MSTYFDRVNDAAAWIRGKFGEIPATAVVLGSGLGSFADSLTSVVAVAYEAIPHWPPSRVVGHAGLVRFEPVSDSVTRVHIRFSYNPPGGAAGHALAWLFGADARRLMDDDLVRMKTLIETGKPPHDAATRT